MAVSMEQSSRTTNRPRWYLMQRHRFGEALLGRAGSEKRQQRERKTWEDGLKNSRYRAEAVEMNSCL